jgi:hypothetical protein
MDSSSSSSTMVHPNLNPSPKALSPHQVGKWDMEEHMRFLLAFAKHPSDWAWIAKQVGTRSRTQCSSHAQKSFRSSKSNFPMLTPSPRKLQLAAPCLKYSPTYFHLALNEEERRKPKVCELSAQQLAALIYIPRDPRVSGIQQEKMHTFCTLEKGSRLK